MCEIDTCSSLLRRAGLPLLLAVAFDLLRRDADLAADFAVDQLRPLELFLDLLAVALARQALLGERRVELVVVQVVALRMLAM